MQRTVSISAAICAHNGYIISQFFHDCNSFLKFFEKIFTHSRIFHKFPCNEGIFVLPYSYTKKRGESALRLYINKIGVTLADAISEKAGISLPCGGKGKCGGCRVIASGALSPMTEDEKRILGENSEGFRLACRAVCMGEVRVELPEGGYSILSDNKESFGSDSPISRGKLGAAIDLGTTTIAAKLIDTKSGKVLASATAANPQSKYGADVMTRIDFALHGGREKLRAAITDCLSGLLNSLTDECIDTAVIVGNTAMLTLLTGKSVEGLAYAPFVPESLFGEFVDGSALGCEEKCGRFYLADCISAFVGGDITSAIIASGLCGEKDALLADIGTNGELCLFRDGKLICTSTAAGPAFEGAEITCGAAARDGAISGVKLKDGKFEVTTVGNSPPNGICAGGLVSAVAAMLDGGIMDCDGYLEKNISLTPDVYLTPVDIRKLQAAKAAVRAGIEVITSGVPCEKIFLAGGIGNYLDTAEAIKIGLLPAYSKRRTVSVGNAALRGACMILQNGKLIKDMKKIAASAVLAELDCSPKFSEAYIENMTFAK